MVFANQVKKDSDKLFFDVLPKETKKAFVFLSEQKWLLKSKWYLAGGTALALQAGCRKSVDIVNKIILQAK